MTSDNLPKSEGSDVEDLVKWVGEQLDEDERISQAASPGPWRANEDHDEVLAVDGVTVAEGFALSGPQLRATVDHIAAHDPTQVLREIAAKRKLLVLHRPVSRLDFIESDGSKAGPLVVCHECDANSTDADWPDTPCWTLRFLAAPYDDRPGYKDDWRP